MTRTLTRDQARRLDARAMSDFGVPGVVLMENAGRSMAELLLSLGATGLVVICCGRGNNGGDGFVIARHLDIAGVAVRVLLFADPATLHDDAAINYQICVKSALDVQTILSADPLDVGRYQTAFQSAAWLVDALFGTGLSRAVSAPLDRVIEAMNAAPGRRFAVDIPSGLDADTGRPLGACVRADHTATVVAPKAGFAAPEARPYLGQVHVVGMGAPRWLVEELP